MKDSIIHVLSVFRLMLLDTRALKYLNTDESFIKKSLFVPIIFTALQCLIFPHFMTGRSAELFTPNVWAFYFLATTIGWVSFLFIIRKITKMIDRRDSFYRYVVAFCWSMPIQFIATAPPFIYQLRIEGESSIKSFIMAFTVTFVYVLQWGIAKTTLKLTTLSAIGIVIVFDLIADFSPTMMTHIYALSQAASASAL